MRFLVTGINGFVGRHLAAELLGAGHSVRGFGYPDTNDIHNQIEYDPADIRDQAQLNALIAHRKPDACIHLAGIAAPSLAEMNPQATFTVNTLGTINLLRALKDHAPECRTLCVSTAQVYGSRRQDCEPVDENTPLRPENIYAITKAAADEAALAFGTVHGIPVMTARPHNHIGPGQSNDFAVAAFAGQVKKLALGEIKQITVGNLESRRDLTDVRDVVRAYRMLCELGTPGQAYNIASGCCVSMREILDRLCRLARVEADYKIAPELFRPTDTSLSLDTAALKQATGWHPVISLDQSLADIMDSLQ